MDAMFWVQIGITALIAFGATFFGVFLSFWVERRRREAEEKSRFARMVQAVFIENMSNLSALTIIEKKWEAGGSAPEPRTEVLRRVLSDPLFHQWAGEGLILLVKLVFTLAVAAN